MVELGRYVFCRRPRARGVLLNGQQWLFAPGAQTYFVTKVELLALHQLAHFRKPIPLDLVEYRRKGVSPAQMDWRREMRKALRRLVERGLVVFDASWKCYRAAESVFA